MEAWPRPQHPLAALDAGRPLCRTNPIFTEEEEQEVAIVVGESGDSPSSSPKLTRTPSRSELPGGELPRRAPSTSSGYGSAASGGSAGSGRSTPPPPGVVPPPPPMPEALFAPPAPAAVIGTVLQDAISRKVSAIQTNRDAPPAAPSQMFSKENLLEDVIAKQLSTSQNGKKKMKLTARAAPVKLDSIFQSTATECALGAAGVRLVSQRAPADAERTPARPVAKVVPSTCFSNVTPPPLPASFQEQLMSRLSQRRKDISEEFPEDPASESEVVEASTEGSSIPKEERTAATAAEVFEVDITVEKFEPTDLVLTRNLQNQMRSISCGSDRSKSESRPTEVPSERDPAEPAATPPPTSGDVKLRMEGADEVWEESALSSSLRADIRSWLVPRPVWPERSVSALLREAAAAAAAAATGDAGVTLVRARLLAALRALPAAPAFDGCRAVPYHGPGVRPGDVTMMPKHTDLMTHLAESARFTLESGAGEALAARLERARARRARGRALLALAVLALLLAAVGAAELLLTRGQRLFGTALI